MIEIRDDEVEMKPREVKKRKPPAEHRDRPAAQASVSFTNTNSVNSTVKKADDTSAGKKRY